MKSTYQTVLAISLLGITIVFSQPKQSTISSLNRFSNYKILIEEKSIIYLKGTSTGHAWQSKATEKHFTGDILVPPEYSFSLDSDIDIKALLEKGMIKNFKLIIPVNKIISSSKILDNNLQKAMDAKIFPNIVFEGSSFFWDKTLNKLELEGNLIIANVTKPVVVVANLSIDNQSIKISGVQKILMTNYNIDPPAFMWGVMQTGNLVEVHFDFYVQIYEFSTEITQKRSSL